MLNSRKKWRLPDTYYQDGSMAEYILRERGYTIPVDDFITVSEEKLLSPYLMKGMKKAVSRIQIAIEKQEHILIYGDYDADGVTATSLLYLILKDLGAKVSYYIPNRFEEGYGLHIEAIKKAKVNGISLIITVDTGISAITEIEFANQQQIDVIITDHHEPLVEIPDAYCILNPKYAPCEYPEASLAGVGVACKLATALLGQLPIDYIDIVALGTVADLVPLVGENRILVALGLQKLNQQPSVGMSALIQVTNLNNKTITSGHLGFQLGPRINASGRLETATDSVDLLISEELDKALLIAEKLHNINEKRQALVDDTYRQVEEILLAEDQYLKNNNVIVLANENWNHGVIGIVASRIIETYYRPVILISLEDGIGKGSARSIEGFHMFNALQGCESLLDKYGGHAMAAGLTIQAENIPMLRNKLNELAGNQLSEEDYLPTVATDIVLTIPEVVIQQTEISTVEQLAPFGMGHAQPKVVVSGAKCIGLRTIGKENNHIKFTFGAGHYKLDVIGFRWTDKISSIENTEILADLRFELLGDLSINCWKDKQNPQLNLQDSVVSPIQFAESEEQAKKITKVLQEHFFNVQCISTSSMQEQQILKLCTEIYTEKVYVNPLQHKCIYVIIVDTKVEQLLQKSYRQPNREEFSTVYKIIASEQLVEKGNLIDKCAKLGIAEEFCNYILAVFEELEFIAIKNAEIKLSANPQKRKLEESKFYLEMLRKSMMFKKHMNY
ncbi:single-stranded-DNA-specific exonuclease RecJ [Desulfuribacillus alkaliarsenatis]|uniref:Single-stranded-DNA-specific exonuclease RecJ n=1 Tax=Desulfuribacillus alkaliarsenatis TaxID=766136 RepID=A0A1E5G0J4_9FIRM|nr:single-stranded-DNA-specific exonuclease RecJ [Desulfuribacillus alkaliarsenatis]OEF96334.1 single-stranded-DNA-specific exonuclease RecJ [Desulfuribacillus alkaliarsenatis]